MTPKEFNDWFESFSLWYRVVNERFVIRLFSQHECERLVGSENMRRSREMYTLWRGQQWS